MARPVATVDPAWYHVVRPAWYELLSLPFADHTVLERCKAENLLTEEQTLLCSHFLDDKNRLVILYLMTNGVRLVRFLDILQTSGSICGKKLAQELSKTVAGAAMSGKGCSGKRVSESAKSSTAASSRSAGGWHSEIIKRSAKDLERILVTGEAEAGDLLLELRSQLKLGGITDQSYTELSKLENIQELAKKFVSLLIESELAAGIYIGGQSHLNPRLVQHLEASSGLVSANTTHLECLREHVMPAGFLYAEETELSDGFFEQSLPTIVPHWKRVAKILGSLSEDEIEFIEKTHAMPYVQAEQMLRAVRQKCREKRSRFSLVRLMSALRKAGLAKEADDIQLNFSAAIKQILQRQAFAGLMQAFGARQLQAAFLASFGNPLNAAGQTVPGHPPWQSQDAKNGAQSSFQSSQLAEEQIKSWRSNMKSGMSEETWQSYQTALKGGRRTVLHERVIICGAGRVGKTSFRRSLLDEKFQEIIDSTIGVELHKVVCTAKRDSKTNEWTWSVVKSEDEHQVLLTAKALTEEVTASKQQKKVASSKSPQHARKTAAGQTAEFTSPMEVRTAPMAIPSVRQASVAAETLEQVSGVSVKTATPPCPKPSSPSGTGESSIDSVLVAGFMTKISAQVRRLLESFRHNPENLGLLKAADNLCFVDVWDFAGQEAFVVIQHMLLAELRCAYAAMFNSNLPLNKHTDQHICQDGEEHKVDSDPDATNFDMLESWLNVIHQVAGGNPAVPVYVVGSHADQLTDDERAAIKQYLWRNIKGKAYSSNVDEIIFVDNTLSGSGKVDSGVQKLRNLLIDMMLKQEAMQLPIPLSWLPFTLIARQLAKETGLPWLTMDEVRLVADELCNMSSPADISNLLQFHHALGQVLHYRDNPNLNGRAIINVEWLLRVVSRLFNPQPLENQDKNFRGHYALLQERGILLESLAQHIWQQDPGIAVHTTEPEHRRFLFHLMEEFSLLYDAAEEKSFGGLAASQYYYVPALVTRVPDSQHATSKDDIEESPPLYLYSGTNQLFPQSLFWCLVVRSMREYSPTRDPILHRTSARVACFSAYWLVLQYFHHGIKIVVEHEKVAMTSCSVPDLDLSLKDVCRQVLPFIERSLNEVKSNTMKHFGWHRSAQCQCSFNDDPCQKHGQPRCPHVSCHHFVVFKDTETPHCSQGLQRAQNVSAVTNMWPCWKSPTVEFMGALALGGASAESASSLAIVSSTHATFTSLREQHHIGAEDGQTLSLVVAGRCQARGVMFSDIKGKARAKIFNRIARKCADRRLMIISLLVGPEGNMELLTSRPGVSQSATESDLLFQGLEMWYEQEDSHSCTGQTLFDTLVEAGCSTQTLQACKDLLGLPSDYTSSLADLL